MMHTVLETIRNRRSTRAFLPTQLTALEVQTLLDAAVWAPSGMNKQLWQFTAIHNADKNLKLARAVADADNRGPDYNFYGAPCSIIVSYQRDENHAFLDGSAAMQTIMLAATALHIDSCWINQLRVTCDAPAVRALLHAYGVPDDHIVIGSVALGHAAQVTAPKPRRKGCVHIED